MAYHMEMYDLDGRGPRRHRVFDMSAVDPADYWSAVTGVGCPTCGSGTVRWAEAGHVPGWRICDKCHRHWLASGSAARPILVYVGRRGRV